MNLTLGEKIIDFYYFDDVQPYVLDCIRKSMEDGLHRPMPLTEEKKVYNVPEFRNTMIMPRLSIRIILRMIHQWEPRPDRDIFQLLMNILYILEGLRAWCCFRGEDIPMIGTDKIDRVDEWIEWGKQRGYLHEKYLV